MDDRGQPELLNTFFGTRRTDGEMLGANLGAHRPFGGAREADGAPGSLPKLFSASYVVGGPSDDAFGCSDLSLSASGTPHLALARNEDNAALRCCSRLEDRRLPVQVVDTPCARAPTAAPALAATIRVRSYPVRRRREISYGPMVGNAQFRRLSHIRFSWICPHVISKVRAGVPPPWCPTTGSRELESPSRTVRPSLAYLALPPRPGSANCATKNRM